MPAKLIRESLLRILKSLPIEVRLSSPVKFIKDWFELIESSPPMEVKTLNPFKLVISLPVISTFPSISIHPGLSV